MFLKNVVSIRPSVLMSGHARHLFMTQNLCSRRGLAVFGECPANVLTRACTFYSNCLYKSDKSARLPRNFLHWPAALANTQIYLLHLRDALYAASRGLFPLPGPNIIDKRLFPPSPPAPWRACRRRRYALRSKCGPLRYAQYLRLARDLSLRHGGSSEKELGLNGYIAGFLAEPGASICMRRETEYDDAGKKRGEAMRRNARWRDRKLFRTASCERCRERKEESATVHTYGLPASVL